MSNNKHFKSECLRRRLFAVSFVCGFLISMFCLSTRAYENPDIEISSGNAAPTITIDATHDVDYKEVDRYLDGMNKQTVKYAKVKDNEIILSDNEIIDVPKYLARPAVQPIFEPVPYTPTTLADLGMKVTADANIAPADNIQLADNEILTLPAVPEFIPAPVTADNSAPIREYSLIHNQSAAAPSSPFIYQLSRALFAGAGLIVICLLAASRSRKIILEPLPAKYEGTLGKPTQLVGSGALFNFDDVSLSKQKMQVNTTYLNMMWHLGRLSKENDVDTYFYMAFYIPPQQQYAADLRKKRTTETESSS